MIFYCLSVLEFCSYSNEFDCYSHPDILFEAFSALRPGGLSEGEMLVKMLKIKDFYEFNFCSNTIVSMCVIVMIRTLFSFVFFINYHFCEMPVQLHPRHQQHLDNSLSHLPIPVPFHGTVNREAHPLHIY